MSPDFAVRVNGLSKCFRIYERPQDRLKQAIWGGRHKQFYKEFWALRDISFTIEKGKAFGIIGRNGSGKSTLLQLICKTLTPTQGDIEVNGRIAALLELGAGFNPEFTGRENVYLNGAILGFTRSEIDAKFADIAAFADIGDFIEQPVKNYSSGMFVRLAFAVQACTEPDILIVDEALSVGDIFFQLKCHARMEELLKRNTAIIFVTHDMSAIEKYCDRVLLLNKGQALFIGHPNEAVERYYQLNQSISSSEVSAMVAQRSKTAITHNTSFTDMVDPKAGMLEAASANEVLFDWPAEDAFLDISEVTVLGDQSIARCTGVALCDAFGNSKAVFEIGETAYFYYEYEFFQEIGVPIGGIIITDKMNINVHGKTSLQYLQQAPAAVRRGTKIRFRQTIELAIATGEYVFQVGLATINPEDYARVTQLEHLQLDSKLHSVLRIRECGRLAVTQKSHGVRLPFYGYVDLKGDASLHVLAEEGEQHD